MNDQVFYNLEKEISKNYQLMNHQKESNTQLEKNQKEIIQDIQIMLDVVDNEQFEFQNNLYKQKNNKHDTKRTDNNNFKSQSKHNKS